MNPNLDFAPFRIAGAALAIAAALMAFKPIPKLTVSEWADKHRILTTENSPRPGKWDTNTTPYLREVMDVLTPWHPSRRVVVKKAAQMGFTDVGINWQLCCADLYPAPAGIWLPTIENLRVFNRTKFQTAIEASVRLQQIIADQVSRSGEGSTQFFKKFAGGFFMMSSANSSASMQMVSLRYIMKDEVSEWPWELEGRGDPYIMVDRRADAFSEESKTYEPSTPGIEGACRISAAFEESDQRHFNVPCPHCGEFQKLEFQNMRYNDAPPYGAHFVCIHNGCVIEHHSKTRMVREGKWVAENPGPGRQPGFHIWQAVSPFKSWDRIVEEFVKSEDDPEARKTFYQQVLGLEWEERGEAPEIEDLMRVRTTTRRGTVPAGVLFLTAAVDVQGDRLEWAVYGWGVGLTSWLIDVGVIDLDPHDPPAWREIDRLLDRRFPDAGARRGKSREWTIEAIGIDSGYLSHTVYRYVMQYRLQHAAESLRVFALDGRPRWDLRAIGSPSTVSVNFEGKKIGIVQLWPVGTYSMKSEIYRSLAKGIRGRDETGAYLPGAAFFPDYCDKKFFEQLTAEYVKGVQDRRGIEKKEWILKRSRRNEQLDLAVYARALAHHLSDELQPEQWLQMAAVRSATPQESQRDLFGYFDKPQPAIISEIQVEPETAPAPETKNDESDRMPAWLGGRKWWG